MSIATMQASLSDRIVQLWLSGRQIAFLVGDENSRYIRAIKTGINDYNQKKGDKPQVRVVVHDRWGGFRLGLSDVPPAKDKTNALANGIQIALMTTEEINEHYSGVDLEFDPADDVIFIFESIDDEIRTQQLTLTLVRKIIQENMCSPSFIKDKGAAGTRGRRMLVFLSTTTEMPAAIPELKPEIVPLPDFTALSHIVRDMVEPLIQQYEDTKGKKGVFPLSTAQFNTIINSLHGMTAQDAEEVIALGLVKHSGVPQPIDCFLGTIEEEKAKVFSRVPGVRFIPKGEIVDHAPPGYEKLDEFLETRMLVSEELAREHGVTPLRAIALGGIPGVGKTEVAKYIARKLGRPALMVNVGELKGSLVGESQQQMRQALQAIRAGRFVGVFDDMDKGSLSGASKGYGGDGGTTGDMTQMILQELSDPTSDSIFVFTFNRLPDMPELLRPGRVDMRYKTVKPNATTRLAILKDHIDRAKMKVDDAAALAALAGSHTENWTGAELAHVLVKAEVFRVLAEKGKAMKVERMIADTKGFTPMVKQKVYAQDIAEMEEGLSQFTEIGNIPEAAKAAPATNRSRRTVDSEGSPN